MQHFLTGNKTYRPSMQTYMLNISMPRHHDHIIRLMLAFSCASLTEMQMLIPLIIPATKHAHLCVTVAHGSEIIYSQTALNTTIFFHSAVFHFRFELFKERIIHFAIKERTASAFDATL